MRFVRASVTRRWLILSSVGLVLALCLVAAGVILHHNYEQSVAHSAPAKRSSAATKDPSRTTAPPSVTAGSSAKPSVSQTTEPTPAVTKVSKSPSKRTTSTHPASVVKPIVPYRMVIRTLNVDAKVSPGASAMHYDKHKHKRELMLPVPDNLTSVTWWQKGPVSTAPKAPIALTAKPGSLGVAEFTMHASLQGDGRGIGDYLGTLKKGAQVRVYGKDDHGRKTLETFTVIGKKAHLSKAKDNALWEAVRSAPKGTRLVLITCSGSVNWGIDSSNFNTVVYTALKSARVVGK